MENTDFNVFREQAGLAAAMLKTMSNEPRLLVLCHLSALGETSVSELVERIGISQSALSQHLARLREEGLVATRKEAQSVFYRLSDTRAERILVLLHELFCPELGNEPFPTRSGDDNGAR